MTNTIEVEVGDLYGDMHRQFSQNLGDDYDQRVRQEMEDFLHEFNQQIERRMEQQQQGLTISDVEEAEEIKDTEEVEVAEK